MREKRLITGHNIGKLAAMLSCEYLNRIDQLSWTKESDK